MASRVDVEGIERAKRAEKDNQYEGKSGARGPVKTFGKRPGLGGNPTDGGGINRKTRPTTQH